MLNVSTGLSGLTVNCENTVVPNPSCCTNPTVLCPECAQKVLTRNVSDDEDAELEVLGEGEDDEPLDRPSWPQADTDTDEEPVVNEGEEFLSLPGNPWSSK